MGKVLIQQARGKGSPRYLSPGHRFKGKVALRINDGKEVTGMVKDILCCPGHSAPLMEVKYEDGSESIMIAPEGIAVGDKIGQHIGGIERGVIHYLKNIPQGVPIFHIESRPGDGGKFCRATGTSGKVLSRTDKGIMVQLGSKRQRVFHENCRAAIGVVAGAGRPEKPFLKAGKKYHQMRARNKLYPRSSACKMNAVDHPYGNKRSSRHAKQKAVGKHTPPGAKVGKLWPKRTGRKN
jgi:large subunit ribosomal protein L2